MNQGNHWPLGSRFMSSEEITAELDKPDRSLQAVAMTLTGAASGLDSNRLTSELRAPQPVSTVREKLPVSWLGRP